MTKRIKQHQLEDISRAKFKLLLPRSWVLRDKDKDYGIDAEVEVFDENGLATGLVFWVQLKATETTNFESAKKINLSISTVKYYQSLDIPVLIVRFSDSNEKFYFKWAHEIDLFYAKKNSKTIGIKFFDENLWAEHSASVVKEHLKKIRLVKTGSFSFPINVFLEVETKSVMDMPRGAFMTEYRRCLQSFSEIALAAQSPDEAILIVKLTSENLTVSFQTGPGCVFHNISSRKETRFVEILVMDICLGLAACLFNVGQHELAAKIALDKNLKSRFFETEEFVRGFIPLIMQTSQYGELIDSICEVMDSYDRNQLESIATISTILHLKNLNEAKSAKVQQLLEKCLAKNLTSGSESLIGISHYNLGNHFRVRTGFDRKSVHNYLMARKFEPNYLKQPYYYSELAGALFALGKYRFSARFYQLALELGAPASNKPLYADALMFSGKYKLSHEVFTEYLETTEDEHLEWHLKAICLKELINITEIEEQVRSKYEAEKSIDLSLSDSDSFMNNLESALELDCLCSDAWFNLGLKHSQSGQESSAALCFTLCALIQPGDIESWVNAVTCALNMSAPSFMLLLIFKTAYFFKREDFLADLYSRLGAIYEAEQLETFIDIFEKALSVGKPKKVEPQIRFLNDEGNFVNILGQKEKGK